jgi:hypothetical protein
MFPTEDTNLKKKKKSVASINPLFRLSLKTKLLLVEYLGYHCDILLYSLIPRIISDHNYSVLILLLFVYYYYSLHYPQRKGVRCVTFSQSQP